MTDPFFAPWAVGAVSVAFFLAVLLGQKATGRQDFFWACVAWPVTLAGLVGLFVHYCLSVLVLQPLAARRQRQIEAQMADETLQKTILVNQLRIAEDAAIVSERPADWMVALELADRAFKAGYIDSEHYEAVVSGAAAEGVFLAD